MKKIITSIALLLTINIAINAQTTKEESNCFLKWAQKFETRGATEVADGTYADVIITFRNGSEAECFSGKCDVKDGKVTSIYLKMEDGTFELMKKKFRYNEPVTITNGMSKTMLTMEDELINVMFVKKLKPKKAGFVKAAEPTDD